MKTFRQWSILILIALAGVTMFGFVAKPAVALCCHGTDRQHGPD